MLRYLCIAIILLLVIWISFFPEPVQQGYSLLAKSVLIFALAALLAQKGVSIFKFSDFPLWLFIGAMGLNVLFAQQKSVALKTYSDLAIFVFVIYYLISEGLFSQKGFNLLLKTICVSSIIVALCGIGESLSAFNPLYEYFIENPFYKRYISGFTRPVSTQFHTVILGSYLLAALPFNAILFKQSGSISKLLGGLGLVLSVVVITLTFSRGVFLGLIATVTFYLFLQKHYRLLLIFFIALILSVIFCTYLPYPINRFGLSQMITQNSGMFSEYRLTRFVMALRVITDHPLVGLGFQHFRIRFYEYYPLSFNVPYEFMIPDNMYLAILAETGLVGFAGFFIFILSVFIKAKKCLVRLGRQPERKREAIFIMAGFTGLLVNMMAYELFYWLNIYIYFCIFIGLIEFFYRLHTREPLK